MEWIALPLKRESPITTATTSEMNIFFENVVKIR